MEEIVRPFQSPQRAPGFRTSPLSGFNESRPLVAIGEESGQTDFSPFARVDEPEDYGWWPRLKMLLAGGQEVASVWKDVSDSFEIDPNVCLIWRLRCQSAALTLTFAALETPSWIDRLLIWRNVTRVATVQVIIAWQTTASPTRTLTLTGVKFPRASAPDWSITATEDVLQLQITSDGEKRGYLSGVGMGTPS